MGLQPAAAPLFAELGTSAAHPAVVAWLARTASEGSDFDGYKVNAFRVADEVGVSHLDATRAFLFATRLGITDLTWDVHCPSCLTVPVYHRHLMDLPAREHCTFCSLRFDLGIEDQLEASFTWNPNVRAIDVAPFSETTHPDNFPAFFRRLRRDGRSPLLGLRFGPDGGASGTVTLPAGAYTYTLPGDDQGPGRLTLAGEPVTEEQIIRLRVSAAGHLDVRDVNVRPGPVTFVVQCDQPKPDWGMHVRPAAPLHNWVSATYITSLQDFRDLFAGEFLAADRSFAIRNITLLFTDITGSTEMYERLGDARAYALVQQHFELMTEVIRRREGGIVKTIGDAVMAAFPVNANAVKAAIEIQRGFAASQPLKQISVKIGLHRGPTIAVTSNRMLDYFGRTVNIAARVQGASESSEVLVTDAVLGDPTVKAWLESERIGSTTRSVTMKGIAGTVPVWSLIQPS